jgi:hypothetical protein
MSVCLVDEVGVYVKYVAIQQERERESMKEKEREALSKAVITSPNEDKRGEIARQPSICFVCDLFLYAGGIREGQNGSVWSKCGRPPERFVITTIDEGGVTVTLKLLRVRRSSS